MGKNSNTESKKDEKKNDQPLTAGNEKFLSYSIDMTIDEFFKYLDKILSSINIGKRDRVKILALTHDHSELILPLILAGASLIEFDKNMIIENHDNRKDAMIDMAEKNGIEIEEDEDKSSLTAKIMKQKQINNDFPFNTSQNIMDVLAGLQKEKLQEAIEETENKKKGKSDDIMFA